MEEISDKFTKAAKKSILESFSIAKIYHHDSASILHLLLAILKQPGSLGAELLLKHKVKETIFFKKAPTTKTKSRRKVKLAQETKDLLLKAALLAHERQHRYIGTEHLLAAIIKHYPKIIIGVVNNNDRFKLLERDVFNSLKGTSRYADVAETLNAGPQYLLSPQAIEEQTMSALNMFATKLTDKNIQADLDPVIARDDEINRLIEILLRRNKNNPLLLGDAGVGKTAIIEGLAKKIYNGDIPDLLANKDIYTLDLSLLIAGTIYRGEFEQRLKQIIAEASDNPNVILFIDEIHQLIGAGATNNAMDAANILKPALARGQIRCIGATTYDEYHKYLANDTALERRFQTIRVTEPSPAHVISILNGIKDNYETFHQVAITPEIINLTVDFAHRYLPHKNFPDKAIDILDEASAKVKIKHSLNNNYKIIKKLEKQLEATIKAKKNAIKNEDFQQAMALKKLELKTEQNLKLKEAQFNKTSKKNFIKEPDLLEVIAQQSGIPTSKIQPSNNHKYLTIADDLKQHIIGQDHALEKIASCLQRNKAGLGNDNKPLGSFLLAGPSGVGKTLTAKTIAREIFGSDSNLIRFDMSEYADKFNMSKLLGAPAGYVGYNESGLLTEQLKKQPFAVILFDEIEKAHPDIHHLLLQMLDEGFITDAQGQKLYLNQTIIILTTNAGAATINQPGLGFESNNFQNNLSLNELKGSFSPELLSRIEEIIVFNKLNGQQLKKIIQLEEKALNTKLNAKQLSIKFSSEFVDFVIKQTLAQGGNVRILQNLLQTHSQQLLSPVLLKQKYNSDDKFEIIMSDKQNPKLTYGN